MIKPKSETEDLLLSISKYCETLIEQTHRKPQEVLELKMKKKPRETFLFSQPLQINGDWMLGLTSVEVYNSTSNITEHNNKFELFEFPHSMIGGISYEKLR